MMVTRAVGVDWSSGAWVAVAFRESEPPEVAVFDEISQVWDEYGETADRIVVDVPIGLCEDRDSANCPCNEGDETVSRHCDGLARKLIGPRSSSVFPPPAREAAAMAASGDHNHEEISQRNRDLTGKGLTVQAASISSGIVEVDHLLCDEDLDDTDRFVEGHPELCFRAFQPDDHALQHSKKTAPGVAERVAALETVNEYEPGMWLNAAEDLQDEDRTVHLDDLLDAFALALTACAPEEEFHRLPQSPPRDAKELPMQMVYRRDEPCPTP